jgi:hypothetical protein
MSSWINNIKMEKSKRETYAVRARETHREKERRRRR